MIDADAYCELLDELEGGIDDVDLDELSGGGVTAASGTVLPAVDSAAYRGLLEAIDTVLAGYPDALLLDATYDGTVLIVTVVPDITECEGFEDLPLPEPVDDLDDVEVLVTVITEDDICEALSDLPEEEPTAGETVDPVDLEDVLEDLFDIRSGADLDPDELADLTGLGEELDAVLAGNPDSSTVSATYDGSVLAIVLTPDPEGVLECEEPVEALPISSPAPADDVDDDDDHAGDGTEVLAVLLGALLVVAGGRRRYRGAHLTG